MSKPAFVDSSLLCIRQHQLAEFIIIVVVVVVVVNRLLSLREQTPFSALIKIFYLSVDH